MRITAGKQVHYDSGPNMTPLVDVVMVILIFLMLAGSFAGAARFIMSKASIRPKGVGHVKIDPLHPPPLETPLNVDIIPKDILTGGFWATWSTPQGPKRTDDPDALTLGLAHQREVFESAGTDPKSIQVVLKPDRGVKYQDLIKVYQAANAAKIDRIAFSALK
jgi:biopolymer transport protein ExbD